MKKWWKKGKRSSGVITRVFLLSSFLFIFFVALRVPHVRVQDSVDGKGPLENKNMNKKRLLLCVVLAIPLDSKGSVKSNKQFDWR